MSCHNFLVYPADMLAGFDERFRLKVRNNSELTMLIRASFGGIFSTNFAPAEKLHLLPPGKQIKLKYRLLSFETPRACE